MYLNSVNAVTTGEKLMSIQHDGTIIWVPSTLFTLPCTMTITYFPWDAHTCDFRIGSWVHPDHELHTTLYNRNWEADISVPNSEWHVKRNPIKSAPVNFGLDVSYSVLTYTVVFQRRTGFFTYVIVVPAILMSFMTIVAFCLPPDFEDKLPIGMSMLFLALFVSVKYMYVVHIQNITWSVRVIKI